MHPTLSRSCREWSRSWPDYSFKHSFTWPHASTAQISMTEAAAAGGTVASQTAHMSSGGAPPQGPHGPVDYQFSGRGGWPGYRRYGGRRFFWFALGIAAATIYFRHKEHHKEFERAIENGEIVPASPNARCHSSWTRRWEPKSLAPSPAPSPSTPVSEALRHSNAPWAGDQWRRANDVANVAPATSADDLHSSVIEAIYTPEDQKAEVGEQKAKSGWGWGNRRRHRQESAGAVGTKAPGSSMGGSTVAEGPAGTELQKLKEVVEGILAERNASAEQAQALEERKANDQARDRLDKLSRTIDALRESLKANDVSSNRKIV